LPLDRLIDTSSSSLGSLSSGGDRDHEWLPHQPLSSPPSLLNRRGPCAAIVPTKHGDELHLMNGSVHCKPSGGHFIISSTPSSSTNIWSSSSSMVAIRQLSGTSPESFREGACATYDPISKSIVVSGGSIISDERWVCVPMVLRFDLNKLKWSSMSPLLTKRFSASSLMIGPHLFVMGMLIRVLFPHADLSYHYLCAIGGHTMDQVFSNGVARSTLPRLLGSVERFDRKESRFVDAGWSLPVPLASFSITLFVVTGELVICGGISIRGPTNRCWARHISTLGVDIDSVPIGVSNVVKSPSLTSEEVTESSTKEDRDHWRVLPQLPWPAIGAGIIVIDQH
jgi:hypothetical protein